MAVLGDTVLYGISGADADAVFQRRLIQGSGLGRNPKAGDVAPAIVVKVNVDTTLNLRVLLDALAAAKQRGQRLGRPRATTDAVVAQVVALAAEGGSPHRIAQALNAAGTPTTRGATAWRASTVRRLLAGHALDLASNEPDLSTEGVA